jgi:recombinational DNA repair ATPase RecF
MPSRNVGSKRAKTRDQEIPAEMAKREAQDRAGSKTGSGRAKSPVDAMHVDAPAKQENARGHRRKRGS